MAPRYQTTLWLFLLSYLLIFLILIFTSDSHSTVKIFYSSYPFQISVFLFLLSTLYSIWLYKKYSASIVWNIIDGVWIIGSVTAAILTILQVIYHSQNQSISVLQNAIERQVITTRTASDEYINNNCSFQFSGRAISLIYSPDPTFSAIQNEQFLRHFGQESAHKCLLMLAIRRAVNVWRNETFIRPNRENREIQNVRIYDPFSLFINVDRMNMQIEERETIYASIPDNQIQAEFNVLYFRQISRIILINQNVNHLKNLGFVPGPLPVDPNSFRFLAFTLVCLIAPLRLARSAWQIRSSKKSLKS